MSDIQVGICFITGILTGVTAAFLQKEKVINALLKTLATLLALALFYTLLSFVYFLLKKNGATAGGLLTLGLHKIVLFFLDGIIISYFVTAGMTRQKFSIISSGDGILLVRFFRYTAAANFLFAGISKIIAYQGILDFFKLSGYSPSFLNFIIIVEIVFGAGLLFKRTAWISALILMMDMLGATYTHYHNYFIQHIPEPFSNSLDSLKWQPFLVVILIISVLKLTDRKHQPTVVKIEFVDGKTD
jgi:uncharacterized membrane protein YphA (DoxX/SURF4 family)